MTKFFRRIRKNVFSENKFLIHIPKRIPSEATKITGLIVSMLLLMACDQKNTLPDPLEAGWEGEKVCEVLVDNEKVRTLKCTFPPGVGHEKHYHAAHFGYTLKGGTFRITDTTGTREVEIPSGYDFYNEKVEWHQVQNIGDSTAIFLIVEPK